MPPSADQWAAFLETAVPVHIEFFNRVIDAYPRRENGLLDTLLSNPDTGTRELEMFVLRNMAVQKPQLQHKPPRMTLFFQEFPITVQRNRPSIPILTGRFRSNIRLIIDSMLSLPTTRHETADIINTIRCPDGPNADAHGIHMNNYTNQQLWAAEHARVNSRVASANSIRYGSDSLEIDLVTREWLRTAVRGLLGLREMSDEDIEAEADTRKSPFNAPSRCP
ncbi:hypothetical protein VNI00_015233 [Paramarasmius palmivorus]|uniref:Uncharacterized protein n=1 Tax=Paramarasmius palmivorus TaxID=297713 RepID=A0AAW0BKB7_9AGAR